MLKKQNAPCKSKRRVHCRTWLRLEVENEESGVELFVNGKLYWCWSSNIDDLTSFNPPSTPSLPTTVTSSSSPPPHPPPFRLCRP